MNKRKWPFLHWERRAKVVGVLGILLMMILVGSLLRLGTVQTKATTTSGADVRAIGLLQTNVYNLNFQNATGNISEIDVAQGQHVVQGQVLARLDAKTLEDAVKVAQVTVNAARHSLDSSKEYAKQVTIFHKAQVDAAQTAVSVSQSNQDAVDDQSDASIDDAEKKLEADRRVLAAVKKSSHDRIEFAEAQLDQNLAACDPPLPQPTPTPVPTQPPQPAPHSPQKPPSVHLEGNASTGGDSKQLCRQVARAGYESDVELAHLDVVRAEADVTKDEQDLDLAKATADVNDTNADGQVKIAKSLVKVAKDAPDEASARAQVTTAQGQLDTAIAQLNVAKSNLSNAVLIAPHAGVVTAINGAVGGIAGKRTNIADGFSSAENDTFIQVTDVGSVRQIISDVNETDILKVKTGQQVQFTLKAYGDRVFRGTVAAISPNGVFNGTSSVYPVIINITPESATDATLLPNMSADVTILTE